MRFSFTVEHAWARGASLGVRNRVDEVDVIGGQAIGRHIQEHNLHLKR